MTLNAMVSLHLPSPGITSVVSRWVMGFSGLTNSGALSCWVRITSWAQTAPKLGRPSNVRDHSNRKGKSAGFGSQESVWIWQAYFISCLVKCPEEESRDLSLPLSVFGGGRLSVAPRAVTLSGFSLNSGCHGPTRRSPSQKMMKKLFASTPEKRSG